MGLETGTTIAALDQIWPLGGDPESQGDDHIRLIKAVLKNIFPGAAGQGFATPITATEAALDFVDLTSSAQAQLTALATAIAAVIAGIQLQQYTAFTTGGTTGAFTLTTVPAITALTAGQRFRVKFSAAGNGTDTIAVDGLAAKNILQYDSTGALVVPVITNGLLSDLEYNGTGWIILDQLPTASTVPTGTIIDFASSIPPLGYLACPTTNTGSANLVSRVTYSALFAAIGTTWGAGDGSTTFGIPYYPIGYASLAGGSGTIGTETVGQVVQHTHPQQSNTLINAPGAYSNGYGATAANATGGTTQSTGGAFNAAAGAYVQKCIKY
jgi:hypothetical protein